MKNFTALLKCVTVYRITVRNAQGLLAGDITLPRRGEKHLPTTVILERNIASGLEKIIQPKRVGPSGLRGRTQEEQRFCRLAAMSPIENGSAYVNNSTTSVLIVDELSH